MPNYYVIYEKLQAKIYQALNSLNRINHDTEIISIIRNLDINYHDKDYLSYLWAYNLFFKEHLKLMTDWSEPAEYTYLVLWKKSFMFDLTQKIAENIP